MLNFVITYVKDTKAFMNELEKVAPGYVENEDGRRKWIINTSPVVKSESGSLALSILTDDELAFITKMKTIKSLGTYDELFADLEALAVYKSVYPYHLPLTYIDEGGVTVEYYRPEKIGEFAL